MANELKLENPLSSDTKPVKVGDDSTGLLLKDNDVEIEGNLAINGSVTTDIKSSKNMTLDAVGDITLDSGDEITLDAGDGRFYFRHNGETNDYSRILVGTGTGATTLQTSSLGDDGNITLDADGALILDSGNGKFLAKNAGTEFSATNSSYAGMILGYTHLTSTGGIESYTLTTSVAVIDADAKVTFVVPPSGNVEIEFSVYRDSSTSNETVYFALSDNATHNLVSADIGDGSTILDLNYSYGAFYADETDDGYISNKFVVCGLTAGVSKTYWISAYGSTGTTYLKWGARTDTSPDRAIPPFIIKATALPFSIHTQ